MNFDTFVKKNPRLTEILRWIFVIPAAIIGALLAFGFIRLIHWLGGESNFSCFITKMISGIVFGGAFVYSAAYVAPRYKIKVAIVFAVILSLASIFTIYLGILNKNYLNSAINLCALIGAVATAIYVLNNKNLSF